MDIHIYKSEFEEMRTEARKSDDFRAARVYLSFPKCNRVDSVDLSISSSRLLFDTRQGDKYDETRGEVRVGVKSFPIT